MSGFINERLSECVSYGFTGGPEWNTQVVQMDNGREVRAGMWLYPRHRFSAAYSNFKANERMELLGAFHACRGRLFAFRFRDWNDFEAVNEPLTVDEGNLTPVQLIKTYAFGIASSTRLIQAPTDCTIKDANGDAVAGTLDTETGLFTPANAWAAGRHIWSGEFDIWTRFDNDYNAFEITGRNGREIMASSSVDLVEVRR